MQGNSTVPETGSLSPTLPTPIPPPTVRGFPLCPAGSSGAASSQTSRRRYTDLAKLMMSSFEVYPIKESMTQFFVKIYGPKDSPYEGGRWLLRVELPENYPYRSPSIGFYNRIFHPNVDEVSGTVCLDVINQTWTPLFALLNIFDQFFPQLMMYPNPSDPLNPDAAALLLREPEAYQRKVKEYVLRYAQEEHVQAPSHLVSKVDSPVAACPADAQPLLSLDEENPLEDLPDLDI